MGRWDTSDSRYHITSAQDLCDMHTRLLTARTSAYLAAGAKAKKTARHSRSIQMSSNLSFRDRVVGAWELVSYVNHSEKSPADVLYPLGQDAKGMILYTPDGYMSAQLQCPGQKAFTAAFPMDGSESELADSAKRYVGYSGRFDVDESGPVPVLLHGFFVSSFPNWIGDTQRRVAKLEGDQLTLSLESPVVLKVSTTWSFYKNEEGNNSETGRAMETSAGVASPKQMRTKPPS